MQRMTGVYVHIPFCERHCPYCDFNVAVVPRPPWERFVASLLREMKARESERVGTVVSLYFGGGTPSLMPVEGWTTLMGAWEHWSADASEVTLEVNPEHADREKMEAWRRLGVGRLSFGTQSLQANALRTLGRMHDPEQARNAVAMAHAVGFEHVSVDLIFGVPGQSVDDVLTDLAWVLEAPGIDHLSLYELTFEPRTSFSRRRDLGLMHPWADDAVADGHEAAMQLLASAGWERYEVSSFARPGGRAVHNQRYWTAGHCVALGPGAVSLQRHGATLADGATRRRNMRSFQHWMRSAEQADALAASWQGWDETEVLDGLALSMERAMTALRTADGCSFGELVPQVAAPLRGLVENQWASRGLVSATPEGFRTTPGGMQVADALALNLMRALPRVSPQMGRPGR